MWAGERRAFQPAAGFDDGPETEDGMNVQFVHQLGCLRLGQAEGNESGECALVEGASIA